MLCCGVCKKMSKRDYKVSTFDGIELEPLGGPKPDKDKDNKTNGVKCSKYYIYIYTHIYNKYSNMKIYLYI